MVFFNAPYSNTRDSTVFNSPKSPISPNGPISPKSPNSIQKRGCNKSRVFRLGVAAPCFYLFDDLYL